MTSFVTSCPLSVKIKNRAIVKKKNRICKQGTNLKTFPQPLFRGEVPFLDFIKTHCKKPNIQNRIALFSIIMNLF